MKHTKLKYNDLFVKIVLSLFPDPGNWDEAHGIITIENPTLDTSCQFEYLRKSIERLKNEVFTDADLLFERYFLSDAYNQYRLIDEEKNTAVSIVQQAPLNGTKVALWIYAVKKGIKSELKEGGIMLERNGYKHLFHTQLCSSEENEYKQTETIFKKYDRMLDACGCRISDHTIRTWIYVQGIDLHYQGMVKARKEHFDRCGLTEQTHYIASTGIEGTYTHPRHLVSMDAYAIQGIQNRQIKYLYASDHLSPTYIYGVTFERGTAVCYGDRKHVFISGTASIDHQGEILFPHRIKKQAERILENIEALLREAGGRISNIAQLIIYLRDIADYQTINNFITYILPDLPKIIVVAPVCRPGWLIEMECIALISGGDERFRPF